MTRRVRVTGLRNMPDLLALEYFERLLANDHNDDRPTQWSTGLSVTGVDRIVREHLRSVLGKVAIARAVTPTMMCDELWVIWDGMDPEVEAEIAHARKIGAFVKIESAQEDRRCA